MKKLTQTRLFITMIILVALSIPYMGMSQQSKQGQSAGMNSDLRKAIEMQPDVKEKAAQDKDFKSLYDDADFKKLIN